MLKRDTNLSLFDQRFHEVSIVKKQKSETELLSEVWLPKDMWFLILDFLFFNKYYCRLLKCVSKELRRIMSQYETRTRMDQKSFFTLVNDFVSRKDFSKLKIKFVFQNETVYDNAAEFGMLEVIKWVRKHSQIRVFEKGEIVKKIAFWNFQSFKKGAKAGNKSVIKWFIDEMRNQNVSFTIDNEEKNNLICKVAESGNFECFKYLYGNQFRINGQDDIYDESIMLAVLKGGNIESLEYLIDVEDAIWTPAFVDYYAHTFYDDEAKHFEMLKYIIENNHPISNKIMENVAKCGSLKALEYLHKNGFQLHEIVLKNAIEGGHSECVKYLLENNCPGSR